MLFERFLNRTLSKITHYTEIILQQCIYVEDI